MISELCRLDNECDDYEVFLLYRYIRALVDDLTARTSQNEDDLEAYNLAYSGSNKYFAQFHPEKKYPLTAEQAEALAVLKWNASQISKLLQLPIYTIK